MKDRLMVRQFNHARFDHVERYIFAAKLVSGKVLDAACGCGYGSSHLHDSGHKVTAVDISSDAIKWAKETFPGPDYIHSAIEDSEVLRLSKFDWVVSFETIEHLKDADAALKVFRTCAPNIVCSVPNEELMPFHAEQYEGDEYPHQRHYTPSQFDELLERNGYRIKARYAQPGKAGGLTEGTDGHFLVYVAGQ